MTRIATPTQAESSSAPRGGQHPRDRRSERVVDRWLAELTHAGCMAQRRHGAVRPAEALRLF